MVHTQQITYKVIEELKEVQDVVRFQEEIWGIEAVTPLPQLIANSNNGGVLVGAFDQNELIGFCFGFPGYKNGKNYLISHMTGIREKYQNYGIGLQLKLIQREWAIKYGYEKIVWTFDPLEARNAYFNLIKLGAYVNTYYKSYYGEMTDKLNKGLPSDRFLAEWDIGSTSVTDAVNGVDKKEMSVGDYQQLLTFQEHGEVPYPLEEKTIDNQKGYLVPVPANFQSLKRLNDEAAKAWRFKLRSVLSDALQKGYQVKGIVKNGTSNVHFYVLGNKMMEDLHDRKN
ncbi:GNAT family N-acetyltransferase [Jeotgalibacillus malaysiensis]|uniref:GNAT family N-acetyltransferase n=1 Tax=Jeotgalibacillus malaysiensis TaxID=1508404 RepID=UPI0038505B32